jgi:hypothetical protein
VIRPEEQASGMSLERQDYSFVVLIVVALMSFHRVVRFGVTKRRPPPTSFRI